MAIPRPAPRERARHAAVLSALFLISAPLHSIIHEGAHVLLARAFGWRASMSYKATYVSTDIDRRWLELRATKPPGDEYYTLTARRTVVFGAGHAANLLLSIGGLAVLAWRRRRPFRPVLSAVGALLAMNAILLVQEGFVAMAPRGTSDIEQIARLNDLAPEHLLMGVGLVGGALCLAGIILYPRDRWRLFAPVSAMSGFVSLKLWMRVLGPLLLP